MPQTGNYASTAGNHAAESVGQEGTMRQRWGTMRKFGICIQLPVSNLVALYLPPKKWSEECL